MSLSHALGEHHDDERTRRERKVAVAAAVRELARNGDTTATRSITDALATRRDGTSMTTTTRTSTTNLAGSTGYADDITHASTPLSGRNED